MSQRSGVKPGLPLLLLALVPGAVTQTVFLGFGTALNLLLCVVACVAAETALLRARGLPVMPQLREGSALLSGILLSLALPAQSPWWIPLLGGVLAMAIGKHLFGPRAQSPFNPAMLALAILLLCFPSEMTRWLPQLDGISSATVLDHVRTELQQARTLAEIRGDTAIAPGALWINLAFLAGGLALILRRRLHWRIPLAVLLGLGGCALVLWASDSSRPPSPLFHCFSGASMLAAFFIATAPPSSPRQPRAQWIYGLGIGASVYAIRSWGHYPDGFAFAILLFNALTPLLEQTSSPLRIPGAARTWLAAVICAASAFALPTLIRGQRNQASPDFATLFPELSIGQATEIATSDSVRAFRLFRQQQVIGVVLIAKPQPGYIDDLQVITVVGTGAELLGVKVWQHRETAGIGDRIELAHNNWISGFSGRKLLSADAREFRLKSDGGEIDQLSGATVSARAVTAAVRESLQYFAAHRAALIRDATPP